MEIVIITLVVFSLVFQILLFAFYKKKPQREQTDTEVLSKLDFMEKNLSRFESLVKDDFRQNREELGNIIAKFQQTFLETLREISRSQQAQLNSISEQNQKAIASLSKTIEERMNALLDKNERINKENREALERSLRSLQDSFTANVKDFNELQKQKFQDMEKKQGELIQSTEKKLEQMRETVDEKLQKTLETRLGQSFELVSKQLESVQKGLGEMQTLASDVGGLKRVLSNVKTRGMLGEIQLGNILEQILAPEQYEQNVRTKKTGTEQVEFAIKLPGRDDNNQQVYLPIDAKFPQEAYHLLQIAYDEGNPEKVEAAAKTLSAAISKAAKDISDKYLDPPFTTDFGIMFLPIEGLYAEVVRNTDLIEQLQRKYKIVVTGPTTLAAILNSLQMGFKTLAIQKRSSEVWQILGAVKTEFGKFGDVIKKTQQRINQANTELDSLVGTRTRAIERQLKKVQELPVNEPSLLIDEKLFDDEADEQA